MPLLPTRFHPLPPKRARTAWIGLLALLLVVSATPAVAGIHPLDDIRTAAIRALGGQPGDPGASATVDPSLRLAPCTQPLQAVASGARTAQVRCGDTPGWRLYVPVQIRREAAVVVLTAPATVGTPIAANQLAVQRRDLARTSGTPFTDPGVVAGRIASRSMAAGDAPTEADLAGAVTLRRGDAVVLVSRVDGVEVRMPGRVLGAAVAGATVAVENTASRKILRGRVTGQGEVSVQL